MIWDEIDMVTEIVQQSHDAPLLAVLAIGWVVGLVLSLWWWSRINPVSE